MIICSSRDSEQERLQGMDAGADHYPVKSSFRDDTLLNAIGTAVLRTGMGRNGGKGMLALRKAG